MNGAVTSYANVLLSLCGAPDAVADAQKAFQNCPQLTDALSNPTIPEAEKFAAIAKGVREVPVLKRLFIYTKKPGHFLVKVSWLLYTIDALNRRFDKHFADLIY